MKDFNWVDFKGRKLFVSIVAGLLCLLFSGYGIQVFFDPITVNLVWSVVFPLIIALAYGSRYGLIAGVFGGAIFPFFLWATDGYANLINFILYQYLYFVVGRIQFVSVYKNVGKLFVRLFLVIGSFVAFLAFIYSVVFPWIVQFNPPFWSPGSVKSFDFQILKTFFIKDSVNYFFLILGAELCLRLNPARKILGLPYSFEFKYNHWVFLGTLFTAFVIWLIFLVLDSALIFSPIDVRMPYLTLALSVLLWSGVLVARILIYFTERQILSVASIVEKESEFRLVFENSADAILWADAETGILIKCNETAAKLFQYEPQELIGKHQSFIHPKEMHEEIVELFKKVAVPGTRQKTEGVIATKSGELRHVSIASTVIGIGKRIVAQGVFVDITERKKYEKALLDSEARLASLIENIVDVIIIIDDKGMIKYSSPNSEKWLGWSKDELIGSLVLEKIHPDEFQHAKDLYKQAIVQPDAVLSTECRYLCKDGSYKWIEVTLRNCLDNPNIDGVLINYRDISERRHARELERDVAIANRSVEFKQKFLANMSHEIRTPLTGVLGMAEMLSKSDLTSHQKEQLNIIIQSGENLREIINLILDFSKIEAGQVKLNMAAFCLSHLFTEVENLFLSLCHKPIEWNMEVDSKIPEVIIGDKQRIGQIIRNYVSNAVKFTQKGQIILRAKLLEEDMQDATGKVKLRIELEDTGKGIGKEKLKSLFRPFYQADEDGEEVRDGTGLGLAICKELAGLMGGETGVESTYGQGSTFWFTFFAQKSDDTCLSFLEEPSPQRQDWKSLHILLVEDKQVNQKVIGLMLQSLGHFHKIANNGQEALDKYESGVFDLILMDVQMPVMDGVSATRELKSRHEALPPIVGLSANAFEGDREKYMQLGMDDYITKPVKSDDFIRLIQRLEL